MADHCCAPANPAAAISHRYRRVLWMALAINAAMFGVEIVAGLHAVSVSLLADAVDFLGDAGNYAISLAALSRGMRWRSRTALIKGITMGLYGSFVLAKAGWNAVFAATPEPFTMGAVGFLALLANLGVAAMLYAYRDGDANMRSVWLCTRNDVIGNVAVLGAALGVFGTRSAWPDLAVACIMASLALLASASVIRHARRELATAPE